MTEHKKHTSPPETSDNVTTRIRAVTRAIEVVIKLITTLCTARTAWH